MDVILSIKDKGNLAFLTSFGAITYISEYSNIVCLTDVPEEKLAILVSHPNVLDLESAIGGKLL
jgi:hypothetical protein